MKISPQEFRAVVLKRTLYPHARWLQGILTACDAEFFRADLDYVNDVQHLRRLRDLWDISDDFFQHPGSKRRLKRVFRLRVSTYRMIKLVRAHLRHGTHVPFELEE